jgi:hypothetical protein
VAPLFWNTSIAALQIAAVIALGRLFDRKADHSVFRLLRLAQDNSNIFSRDALRARRSRETPNAPWLADFLARSYTPKPQDFRKLRKAVVAQCAIYDSKYRDIRHKIYAHRTVSTQAEMDALFAKTNIRELQRMLALLNELQVALWELFVNGRRPILRRGRYSVVAIRRSPTPKWQTQGVHERILADVDGFFDIVTPARRRKKRT